jgi:hypothetical protein
MKDSLPDEKTPEERSPTETLVWCLEDFGASEPERVLVIWVNESGELCWSSSGPYKYTHILGMLECVKLMVQDKFREVEDGL